MAKEEMKDENKSIWEKSVSRVRFDSFKCNKNTDVLIIGGGIAGILCAYKLQNAGVDCMLAEATEICGGITQNTTAKITLQHGIIYDKMIKRFGEDKARLYAEAQSKAGKEYAKLCENIDCDYETRDSYVYSLTDRKKIEKEVVSLNRIGEQAELEEKSRRLAEVNAALDIDRRENELVDEPDEPTNDEEERSNNPRSNDDRDDR